MMTFNIIQTDAGPRLGTEKTAVGRILPTAATGILEFTRCMAEKGRKLAIQLELQRDPVGTMQNPEIAKHIERWLTDPDTHEGVLEKTADSFRKGLLCSTPGRPQKIPEDAVWLADEMQRLFDAERPRIKKQYRNPAARKMSIRELCDRISKDLRTEYAKNAHQAMIKVLMNKPRLRKGFGCEAAAKLFGCTARRIRSLQRKM